MPRRRDIGAVALLTIAVLTFAPAPAGAVTVHGPPMAGLFDFLNPIGNIAELVGKVISALFRQLAKVLMPDFLKNATVDTLKWLCSVPNPADPQRWRNVNALSRGVTAIAWGLLPLPFMLAALRAWGQSLTGSGSPLMAVQRVTLAAFGLVIYPWACRQAIALANVVTNAMLSTASVDHGLSRVTKILFGPDIVTGLATPFLGLLALIAIVLGTLLFALKIALLLALAILFAGGPLVLALYPLPETAHLFRLWMYVGIALLLIPIGWVLIFSTAGALILDATDVHNLVGGAGKVIDQKTTAALAGLLAFALAVVWPKTLITHAIARAGMFGVAVRAPGINAGRVANVTGAPSRARAAMASLRDGGGPSGAGGRRAAAAAAFAGGAGGAGAMAGRLGGSTTPTRTPTATPMGLSSGAPRPGPVPAPNAERAAQVRGSRDTTDPGAATSSWPEVPHRVDRSRGTVQPAVPEGSGERAPRTRPSGSAANDAAPRQRPPIRPTPDQRPTAEPRPARPPGTPTVEPRPRPVSGQMDTPPPPARRGTGAPPQRPDAGAVRPPQRPAPPRDAKQSPKQSQPRKPQP